MRGRGTLGTRAWEGKGLPGERREGRGPTEFKLLPLELGSHRVCLTQPLRTVWGTHPRGEGAQGWFGGRGSTRVHMAAVPGSQLEKSPRLCR